MDYDNEEQFSEFVIDNRQISPRNISVWFGFESSMTKLPLASLWLLAAYDVVHRGAKNAPFIFAITLSKRTTVK